MKTFLRVATSPDLKENGALLDEILKCESWHTLTTFAREMARKSSSRRRSPGHLVNIYHLSSQLHNVRRLLHQQPAGRPRWTRTSRQSYTSNSDRTQGRGLAARSRYVHTARSRTHMEGTIARCAACPCLRLRDWPRYVYLST